MPNLRQSEALKDLLRAFVRVIGRRTSEKFALQTIGAVVKHLELKYSFLKYVEIKTVMYSGEMDAINITQDMDTVEAHSLGKAINDLLDTTATSLSQNEDYVFENADYYFIKEVRDELGDIYISMFKTIGVDLDLKQSDFLLIMKEAEKTRLRKIRLSDILEPVINVLTYLLKRQIPEKDALKIVVGELTKASQQYVFLRGIKVRDTPNLQGLYTFESNAVIDAFWEIKMAEATQKLIGDIGKIIDSKKRLSFIEDFKNSFETKDLIKLKKLGVDLDQIEITLQQYGQEILIKKTLETLVDLMGLKTSKSFAVASLDAVIEKLRSSHPILTYVMIDKSRYSYGIDAIGFMPEINTAESSALGRALKDIIKKTQENLGDTAPSFIADFKKKLGDEYLAEIEKIGVNLHILELRTFR